MHSICALLLLSRACRCNHQFDSFSSDHLPFAYVCSTGVTVLDSIQRYFENYCMRMQRRGGSRFFRAGLWLVLVSSVRDSFQRECCLPILYRKLMCTFYACAYARTLTLHALLMLQKRSLVVVFINIVCRALYIVKIITAKLNKVAQSLFC